LSRLIFSQNWDGDIILLSYVFFTVTTVLLFYFLIVGTSYIAIMASKFTDGQKWNSVFFYPNTKSRFYARF
jgi:hypothetical protein